jgi:hypothetical protein
MNTENSVNTNMSSEMEYINHYEFFTRIMSIGSIDVLKIKVYHENLQREHDRRYTSEKLRLSNGLKDISDKVLMLHEIVGTRVHEGMIDHIKSFIYAIGPRKYGPQYAVELQKLNDENIEVTDNIAWKLFQAIFQNQHRKKLWPTTLKGTPGHHPFSKKMIVKHYGARNDLITLIQVPISKESDEISSPYNGKMTNELRIEKPPSLDEPVSKSMEISRLYSSGSFSSYSSPQPLMSREAKFYFDYIRSNRYQQDIKRKGKKDSKKHPIPPKPVSYCGIY